MEKIRKSVAANVEPAAKKSRHSDDDASDVEENALLVEPEEKTLLVEPEEKALLVEQEEKKGDDTNSKNLVENADGSEDGNKVLAVSNTEDDYAIVLKQYDPRTQEQSTIWVKNGIGQVNVKGTFVMKL